MLNDYLIKFHLFHGIVDCKNKIDIVRRASLKFKKEFYKDSDIEPEKEIFFTLSLIPFGGVTTGN